MGIYSCQLTGVEYYVIGHDGKEYGPAGIDTLKAWVLDGRVQPATTLKSFATGQLIPASSLKELFSTGEIPPVAGPWSQPPSPYQRPVAGAPIKVDTGGSDLAWAIVRSVLALVFFFFAHGLGLIIAAYGLMYAIRAQQKGHRLGVVAIVISALTLVAIGIGWMFRLSGGGV